MFAVGLKPHHTIEVNKSYFIAAAVSQSASETQATTSHFVVQLYGADTLSLFKCSSYNTWMSQMFSVLLYSRVHLELITE